MQTRNFVHTPAFLPSSFWQQFLTLCQQPLLELPWVLGTVVKWHRELLQNGAWKPCCMHRVASVRPSQSDLINSSFLYLEAHSYKMQLSTVNELFWYRYMPYIIEFQSVLWSKYCHQQKWTSANSIYGYHVCYWGIWNGYCTARFRKRSRVAVWMEDYQRGLCQGRQHFLTCLESGAVASYGVWGAMPPPYSTMPP